jgi:NADPH2:quinone reductase
MTMLAMQYHTTGEADVLHAEQIPLPEPGPRELRVRLEAIGVNFVDVYQRKGFYSVQVPAVPGSEGAGTVDAVGSEVSDFHLGDRVASARLQRAYAQCALVPASQAIYLPPAVETRVAAAVMLQGLTAHFLTHSTYPLKPGETALVHAAAGGVGGILTQLARIRGARVIGTVSTDEKAEIARQAGASAVIRYTEQDFTAETRRLTDGEGVDVVYDSVGKATFDKSLDCLRPRGYMVLYGQSSGPVPPLDPQMLNHKGSLFLTRPTYADYIADRAELVQRCSDLFDWIQRGMLTVRIDREFPLAEAAAAHRYLEGRQTKGKVLLIP